MRTGELKTSRRDRLDCEADEVNARQKVYEDSVIING